MSSKFSFSRRPQPTPKVCRKQPPIIPPAFQLWPLQMLAVYAGWRSTQQGNRFLHVARFTLSATIYPNTWQGYSAATGRRFFVHMAHPTDDAPFDFALTLYQDDDPVDQVLWNGVTIDTDKPFNSRLLTRGPPDVLGHANLMITE